MRMPLTEDYKAEELITDVGGNTEGPEAVITVDEYLMPSKWADEEKTADEVCLAHRSLVMWVLGFAYMLCQSSSENCHALFQSEIRWDFSEALEAWSSFGALPEATSEWLIKFQQELPRVSGHQVKVLSP